MVIVVVTVFRPSFLKTFVKLCESPISHMDDQQVRIDARLKFPKVAKERVHARNPIFGYLPGISRKMGFRQVEQGLFFIFEQIFVIYFMIFQSSAAPSSVLSSVFKPRSGFEKAGFGF